jgi:transposase-like protein
MDGKKIYNAGDTDFIPVMKKLGKVDVAMLPIGGSFTTDVEEAALAELDSLEEIWGKKYPLSIKSWRTNWAEIATYFKYPKEIRKIIYTTNSAESFHWQLNEVTKSKSIFLNDKALLKMLYLATLDATEK